MNTVNFNGFFAFLLSTENHFKMASPRAIQLITLKNHTFELHEEKLRQILDTDGLRDRNVVIVSIAGAFRKGKSFLLNFFLKYLYAQVMIHSN